MTLRAPSPDVSQARQKSVIALGAETWENLLAFLKVLAFFGLILTLVPVQFAYGYLRPQDPFRIPRLFHVCLLRIFGMRLHVIGQPTGSAPVFFVANHVSYLDIPVLGSLLNAAFIAKSEVASWPLFGFLAKMQHTVFIERRRTRAADQRTQLQTHLAQKGNLILFPEGTSTEGVDVLPFKSTLFSIVEEAMEDIAVTIQPVSVTCTELDGLPLLRDQRPRYAWYGDMELIPHLWNAFKKGAFTVEVIFHMPLAASSYPDRKALAAACQAAVAEGVARALTRHM